MTPQLVNDLDLRVIDPAGTVHHPWTLDPANPAAPAVRTVRDGVNNIEQVTIDTPPPGTYVVEVHGWRIAQGTTQRFGLAATPALGGCTSTGAVSIVRDRLRCADTLEIQVLDCDLNVNSGTIETTAVTVTSPSEPTGETVVLTEIDKDAGVFAGSIPVATANHSGVLRVANGEQVQALYVDANDGHGGVNVPATRTATVDCVVPAIIQHALTSFFSVQVTGTLTVDEPAVLGVRWGQSCGTLDRTFGSSLRTSHPLRFLPLTQQTTYYYVLDLEDVAGNTVTYDNGGACFSFTTPPTPSYLTQTFGVTPYLRGKVVTFTPDGSASFYSRCNGMLSSGLPTDPTGSTVLPSSTSVAHEVQLLAGRTVSLYGQSYDRVYVALGGIVTFGFPDVVTTTTDYLGSHFAHPRVSALLTRVHSVGTLGWKQMQDRVAITWEGINAVGGERCTFQVELFFDGRIRLSWLELTTQNGVVGLSRGGGIPPDYAFTDLTTGPLCGGREPFANHAELRSPISVAAGITLGAFDDELPAPPSLTYRVLTVPELGTLVDNATGAPITAVPYQLGATASALTYTPVTGQHGLDRFEFDAHDGGAPPTGGRSSPASVLIDVGSVLLHEFLVDDSDPHWTTEGMWAFGRPTGGGTPPGRDPTSGATGLNVYGYNLAGNYAPFDSERYLTTPSFDFSRVLAAQLEYQRWLNVESALASIQLGIAASWQTLWTYGIFAPPLFESTWSPQRVSLTAAADMQPSVTLRWRQRSGTGDVQYGGWNVDDVRIFGRQIPPCSGVPGEATDLRLAADKLTLDWRVGTLAGGFAPTYDLLRAPTPDAFATATCVASGIPETASTDAAVPAADAAFFYLVRAVNECGAGALGQSSSGGEIGAPVCP